MGLYDQFRGGITATYSQYWTNAVFNVPTLEECEAYPTTNCQEGGEPIHYDADVCECPIHYEALSTSLLHSLFLISLQNNNEANVNMCVCVV
jgi:hypothetical protein